MNNGPSAETLAPVLPQPPSAQSNPAPPSNPNPAPAKRSVSGQVFSASSGNIHHAPMENGLDYRHGGSSGSSAPSSSSQQASTTIR